MDIESVKSFFDMQAPLWDEHLERDEAVISLILDKSEIGKGTRVLDVATGTGVLVGDYLERGATVTGIDISEEMLRCARKKFPCVEFICADAQSCSFTQGFDAVMIYNAFPHFPSPEKLFSNLAAALVPGGRLTVAHGMSEEALRKHHSGAAKEVSAELPCKEKTAELMSPYLEVDVMISDDRMYMVSGVKNKEKNQKNVKIPIAF